MTEHEETPRNGSDSPVMFVGGLVIRFFGAVAFLGGFALIVAGIVNIVGLHDRAGGTTGIVLGSLFMLAGSYLWNKTLASEPPRWRIRSVKVPQTSNGRSVGKHRMNYPHGVPSIRRKMLVLGISAPISLAAGVAGLLWCTHREPSYCGRSGALLAQGVIAIIGVIYLSRRLRAKR
jgi:hypothetical protein